MVSNFEVIRNISHLAAITRTKRELIEAFATNPQSHVRPVSIPRRAGARAPRDAWRITTPGIQSFLRALALKIEGYLKYRKVFPKPAVHGYVVGRSALTNASTHVGSQVLLKADVKDFFQSIKTEQVVSALLKVRATEEGAALIAQLVTLNGALPLGYSSSPTISNLVMLDVDSSLLKLAQECDAKYTRYADDITFSGDVVPTTAEVADVLSSVGLAVNLAKCKTRKRGQALYVTGYSVTDVNPHAPRKLKKKLRQELYYIEKYGLAGHVQRVGAPGLATAYNRIVGQIAHVRYVDADAGEELQDAWDARPIRLDGTITRNPTGKPEPITLLFDDTEFGFQNRKFRALGVAIIRDYADAREAVKTLVQDLQLEPLMPERAGRKLFESGLHFADLPLDFHRDVVLLLQKLGVRGHIVFDISDGSKKEQLQMFLRNALRWRLRECRGRLATLIFEEGEYVKQKQVESVVSEVFANLQPHERPLRIDEIKIVSKVAEPCVALPDAVLGIWQRFACSGEPKFEASRERNEQLYETVRRQIGTIYQPSTRTLNIARRPFAAFELPA